MALCATATAAAEVAPALRAPGLLDCALTLRSPGAEERAALMASSLSAAGVTFNAEHVQVPCMQAAAALHEKTLALGIVLTVLTRRSRR